MMILKNFNKFLEEKELNLDELGKIDGNKTRGNELVKKLKNYEPLTTLNNKSVEIKKMKDNGNWLSIEDAIDNLVNQNGEYDSDKAKNYFKKSNRYQPVFKDDKGDEFKLNQFKKTDEFGSSGAGRLTKEFETLQTIFLSIKQGNPNQKLTPDNISNFYDSWLEKNEEVGKKLLYTVNDVELDRSLIQKFEKDKYWIKTFCDIPNEIWKDKHLNLNNTYVIYQSEYRGNSPISVLKKMFQEFSKKDFKGVNFAKWCPADVYFISVDIVDEISNYFKKCSNIEELTNLCDNLFDEKKFIPISLKKIGKDNFIIITNKEVDKELPVFVLKKFVINKDAFKGIGSKIHTKSYWKYRNKKMSTVKDRILNIDSSDTNKSVNVDGEVDGSTSRHGKISLNAIRQIIESFKLRTGIQSFSQINDSKELKEKSIDELKQMTIDLNREIKTKPRVFRYDSPRSTVIEGSKGKLISKIQSLQVVLAINEIYLINQDVANEVITSIMRYALSIKTDYFESPRYLRVI